MPQGVDYKLKQLPEDFQVEELTRLIGGADGPFAFYRLEKRGWTTPDALDVVRRRWKIEPRRIAFGGLKDRHALTVQYLTIFHGPQRGLDQQGIRVEYLGQVSTAYTAHDFDRNRFRLTVRALAPSARPELEVDLSHLAVEGVPNYFDDQRFGSVSGEGGEFIGRLLVRGRFEEALRLALTAPYEHDRAAQKAEKHLLEANWGNWKMLRERLPRGPTRSLIDYLQVHPHDFRGTLARLSQEMRMLYLSAYQSHLWNRLLATWLRQHCPADQLRPVALRLGEVPFHVGLVGDRLRELSALALPLMSSRLKLADDDLHAALVQTVVAEEGLTLRDLQVRGIREMFFSKGERQALCMPQGLTHNFAADELCSGKEKLLLAFDLPRGSYATLIVKRLFGSGRETSEFD